VITTSVVAGNSGRISPQPTLALQRWLNLRAKERGQFEDDGAIAIFWNTVETQDFVETQNFASLPPKTT
jgi:hypothetical protein